MFLWVIHQNEASRFLRVSITEYRKYRLAPLPRGESVGINLGPIHLWGNRQSYLNDKFIGVVRLALPEPIAVRARYSRPFKPRGVCVKPFLTMSSSITSMLFD